MAKVGARAFGCNYCTWINFFYRMFKFVQSVNVVVSMGKQLFYKFVSQHLMTWLKLEQGLLVAIIALGLFFSTECFNLFNR